MVVSCCAYGCTERFHKGGPYTFHSFPKDENRRTMWIKQLRRENFTVGNHTKICSKHFEADCFEGQLSIRRLKSNALPTIFDFPAHLVKQVKPRKRSRLTMEGCLTSSTGTSAKKYRYIGDFSARDITSPTKAHQLLLIARASQEKSKKRMRKLKKQNTNLARKVSSLEDMINNMKERSLISESAGNVLKISASNSSCAQLLKRLQKKGSKTYPRELRAFALTLNFYSNKAYKYIRKVFLNALPHPVTLRKWYASINGEPGFTSAALSALQMKALEASTENKRVICALVVDEMSIRKHIEWDGKRFCGYVDYGTDIDDDELPVASEAYTFLLNAVNGNWKIPVGYFLISGLDASERANLIRKSLEVLHETGIDVISLTFDGTSVNLSTAKHLGCSINPECLNTSFKHPTSNKDVCVLLDPSHMIKLIRNTLSSKGSLFDGKGEMIKWEYIISLHKFQQKEGLLAATKIRTRHIQWSREKMKVKLATQVMSGSVADALLYLANDLKLPEFQGCEATVEFLKCFNTLFDILNSQNLLSKGFKAPLQKFNSGKIFEFFTYAENYIRGLKTAANGQLILASNRKTGFLGFLVCLSSVKLLYKNLIESDILKFILTYKLSQDHLEMFFSTIRSKGGFNNNPTAKQFKAAYIRLLSHHEITSSNFSNCLPCDDTHLLNVSSSKNQYAALINKNLHVEYFNIVETEEMCEYNNPDLSFSSLSNYVSDVVLYIAGFIIRKLCKTLRCTACKNTILHHDETSNLIKRKNRGGLVLPSVDVGKVCKIAEKRIRFFQTAKYLCKKNVMQSLITGSMMEIDSSVFTELNEHILNQDPLNNHKILLLKTILFEYFKLRLSHIAKTFNEELQRKKNRSINTKLILFNGY